MRKVDFILIGAQKGGTTAAGFYLSQHPKVCFANGEPHFFDRDFAPTNYDRYHSLFPKKFENLAEDIKIGEKTPSYAYIFDSINRIHQYNPEIKLVLSLREPVSRAYSQWGMYRGMGRFKGTFEEFMLVHSNEKIENIKQNSSYPIQRGLYFSQIQNILSLFDKSQLKIIISEEMRVTTHEIINEVFDFLALESFLDFKKEFGGNSSGQRISQETIKKYHYLFEEENQKLYDFLGFQIQTWENNYN